jgi:diguanylate cyclase (GGDEF)-like protein/PAS domain S-box-containing protein
MVIFLAISLLGFYTIIKINVLGNVNYQEKELMQERIKRAKYLIDDNIAQLNVISADYAYWDDTLNFVNNFNSQYILSNLNDDSLNNLQINAFIVLNKSENIVYSKMYDTKSKTSIEIPSGLINYISEKKALLCNHSDINSAASGIISVNGKLMMISSRPITNSEYSGPIGGTLIMGRYLDSGLISRIETISGINLRLYNINGNQFIGNTIKLNNDKLKFNTNSSEDTLIDPSDKNCIVGYALLDDIANKPTFIMEASEYRTIYNYELKSMYFLIVVSSLGIITLFGICMILLRVFIVKPVEEISKHIAKIKLSDNSFSRIKVKGKDEVSTLALEINNMLEKIEVDSKKIKKSEKQLKLVLEGANAGFWDWNIEKDILKVNHKFLSILGYSKGELPKSLEIWEKIVHKNDLEYSLDFFKSSLRGSLDVHIIEHRLLTKSGEYKWILNQCRVVKYSDEGEPIRMTGIITDINEKKKYEEELKYLTYYDKLTGVFNRGYYEFIMDKMDLSNKLPVSIIMGDLNGLKISNDTFGHELGDKLLVETADILKKVTGNTAIISRYGGDEFAIILEDMGSMEADKICLDIKKECSKRKVGSICVNIALGHSTKVSINQNMREIIKEAEERMYRNKLLEDRSARNSIIASLSKTLAEKSHETEEHAERIYKLCTKIGNILNLSTEKMDELYLLAKLHDIGKIGIDDKILNKPGKLTDEEWCTMKTHSEIGYRIASSNQDLAHIAYGILTHHERYDGTGYPKGIKGEQIPLLSRLLSIADSFDVMTHDRPYKKAFTVDEAIEELKRCAGTQFDPNLVLVCIEVFKD